MPLDTPSSIQYKARKQQILECRLYLDSQVYLTRGCVDDVLGGRQNADLSPGSNAMSTGGATRVRASYRNDIYKSW